MPDEAQEVLRKLQAAERFEQSDRHERVSGGTRAANADIRSIQQLVTILLVLVIGNLALTLYLLVLLSDLVRPLSTLTTQ